MNRTLLLLQQLQHPVLEPAKSSRRPQRDLPIAHLLGRGVEYRVSIRSSHRKPILPHYSHTSVQPLCLYKTSLPFHTNRTIQVGAHEMITLNGVDIALYSDNLDDFTDNIAVFRNKGN